MGLNCCWGAVGGERILLLCLSVARLLTVRVINVVCGLSSSGVDACGMIVSYINRI